MTEADVRKKFREVAIEKKWLWYYPPRTRFHTDDIFGIADVLVWRPTGLALIQLTTASNLVARVKKIEAALAGIPWRRGVAIEVWAWHKKKKIFKIRKVV